MFGLHHKSEENEHATLQIHSCKQKKKGKFEFNEFVSIIFNPLKNEN